MKLAQAWLAPVSFETARYNQPVKLEIAEDDIPLLVRALKHYAAYLEATKRPDERYVALAEELKRKQPQAESAKPEKSAKCRA
jgi:hypothetical protein